MTISPLNTVQEQQVGKPFEAWRILIVCSLLNRTHGRQVRPMVDELFDRWPTPHHLALSHSEAHAADWLQLQNLIRPLGFVNRRSKALVEISRWCSNTWTLLGPDWYKDHKTGVWAMDVPHCSQYAIDSLNICLYGVYDVPSSDTWLKQLAAWKRENA